jgi:hypothetical protein
MFATKLLTLFDRIALPLFRTAVLGGGALLAVAMVAQG